MNNALDLLRVIFEVATSGPIEFVATLAALTLIAFSGKIVRTILDTISAARSPSAEERKRARGCFVAIAVATEIATLMAVVWWWANGH